MTREDLKARILAALPVSLVLAGEDSAYSGIDDAGCCLDGWYDLDKLADVLADAIEGKPLRTLAEVQASLERDDDVVAIEVRKPKS